MKKLTFLVLLFYSSFQSMSIAKQPDEIQQRRISGYGAVLGRGLACGMQLDDQFARVVHWIDRTFQEDAEQTAEMLLGVVHENYTAQKHKKVSESCDQVEKVINDLIWP